MHEHDYFGRNERPSVSWYGDEFKNFTLTDFHVRFSVQQSVHIKDIPRGLDLAISELHRGTIRLCMTTFAHIPARRFWAYKDEGDDDQRGKHSGSHHEAPVETLDMRSVFYLEEDQIGDITKHNAKRGPHLPLHDQCTTNCWRSRFGSVDWDGRRFRPNPKTKEEPSDEHVPPSVDEALPEAGQSREETSDEDRPTTAEPVVERNSQPAADESAAEVRCRVGQSE